MEITVCGDGFKDKTYKNPDCFTPNDDPYPLCKGKGDKQCKYCCLYENYAGDSSFED